MIKAIREWAARHTTERRYSPVGIVFHWVMAALILFQLYWGWHMGRVPVGPQKLAAFSTHADIGLLMLVLAGLRLLWRTIVPAPQNDADQLGWQTKLSYLTHGLFYICFFGLPLSGWAMWSALGDGPALRVAGVLPWPQMPLGEVAIGVQWWVMQTAEQIHWLLVVLLLVMIPLHIGAALKHHFWDKHDVLIGMLPELDEDRGEEGPPRPGLQELESVPR